MRLVFETKDDDANGEQLARFIARFIPEHLSVLCSFRFLNWIIQQAWQKGARTAFSATNTKTNGQTTGDIDANLPANPFNANSDDLDLGDMSDGYHTFNELYRYRMLYNAAFLNTYAQPQTKVMSDGNISIIVPNVGKSWLHHDGQKPFGGGWFIVWFTTPDGHTITNHYEAKYWDLFKIPEEKTGPEWNGSTPQQEADYLEQWLTGGKRNTKE